MGPLTYIYIYIIFLHAHIYIYIYIYIYYIGHFPENCDIEVKNSKCEFFYVIILK